MRVTKIYHIKLGGYVSNQGISYEARGYVSNQRISYKAMGLCE